MWPISGWLVVKERKRSKSGVVCLGSVIWLGSFGFLEVSLVFTFYFGADVGVSCLE